MNPFEYVKDISEGKENLLKKYNLPSSDYVPYLVNNALSRFPDCIYLVNYLNRNYNLPNDMQYEFLLHTVEKSKRYSGKWAKEKEPNNDLAIVMEYFDYSRETAMKVLPAMTEERLKEMKISLEKGGFYD